MKVLRTISSALLALLVLLSSTTFMVGMHRCMGEVQDIAFFSKADGCEKEQSLPPCHRHTRPACCGDESFFHEGSALKASAVQHFTVVAAPAETQQLPMLISEIVPAAPVTRVKYHNRDAPLPSLDATIAYRVLLI